MFKVKNTDPKAYAFRAYAFRQIEMPMSRVVRPQCSYHDMRYSHLFAIHQFHELMYGISLEAQFTRAVAKWINTTINYYLGVNYIVI
jgi:hypothetical protein